MACGSLVLLCLGHLQAAATPPQSLRPTLPRSQHNNFYSMLRCRVCHLILNILDFLHDRRHGCTGARPAAPGTASATITLAWIPCVLLGQEAATGHAMQPFSGVDAAFTQVGGGYVSSPQNPKPYIRRVWAPSGQRTNRERYSAHSHTSIFLNDTQYL